MTFDNAIALITIALSLLAAAGSAVAWLASRPQASAQKQKTLADAYTLLSRRVNELEAEGAADRQRIRTLEKQAAADHDRIRALEREAGQQRLRSNELERLLTICVVGIQALTNQLIREGIEPDWFVPADLDRWITQFFSKHNKETR